MVGVEVEALQCMKIIKNSFMENSEYHEIFRMKLWKSY
jgi:hypothetical protein